MDVSVNGVTVLIVDDIHENIINLQDFLEDYDFNVLTANNGDMVFAILKKQLPDLILLDVKMPGLSGFEICRRIKAEEATKEIPVIFMTALNTTSDKLEGFEAGGVDYVTKPFSGEEVLARVKTHVGLKRAQEELKKKNEELLKTKNQLEESHKLAKMGRFEHDLLNDKLYWSLGTYTILGLDPKTTEPSYKEFLKCVHVDDRKRLVNERRKQTEFGGDSRFVYRLQMEDGEVKTVSDIIHFVTDGMGRPIIIQGVTQDISEITSKEEELRTLARAVEQSPINVIITDPAGNVEYANSAFTTNTGFSLGEAFGQNPRVLKSGLHPDSYYKDVWETISSGQNWQGEFCNRKKNGSLNWVQAYISPVINEYNQITHYIGMQEDISRKKELESVRNDVDRILRHDLKSPLNAIVTYPQLIKKSDNLTEKQKLFISRIQEAGNSMLEMIESYLDFYKVEAGEYRLNPIQIDMVNIVQRVINDLETLAKERDVQLDVHLEMEGAALIRGEDALLYASISNLVKNAIEASEKNQTVQIEITSEMTGVSVHIRNQGVVPEQIQEQFFDKYMTYGKPNGTGLGTYSAKLLTELHGGSIYMSSAKESGTEIIIKYPPLS